MNTRSFGKDQIQISEVGLGCWQFGGDWGDVSASTATDILQASVDNGVTFFDTADVYGAGCSEEIIGNFLKDRDDIFVATKIGRAGIFPDNYTEATIRDAVDACLKRLQMDALDLVQLHCIPTQVMADGEIFGWLSTLKKEGKIKRFGASVESMDEAQICIDGTDAMYSLQIIFNIFRQKPIKRLFDTAKEKQVGIIARVPLASGLLTGKMKADTIFPESDHRNYNKDGDMFNVGETFAGLPYAKGVDVSEKIAEHVPDGMSMAQMSLRWILDHDAVSVVIPGASRVEQAINNAAVSELPSLSDDVHETFRSIYTNDVKDHIRGPY
jgi:aryl-alcohol dehydrogenase-like predicted oxidoreductase